MNLWQQFLRPTSVSEAVDALASSPGPACLIAGGTDLILDLRQGHIPPYQTLVDINDIPEMTFIEERGRELYIGAAVPVNRIALNKLVMQHAQALVDACNLIGGPQVRNMATLGGNIAHALPAADGTIALMSLDTQAEIAGSNSRRRVPLVELFSGPGRSTLIIGQELIVGFYLPCKNQGEASAFKRIMRAQGIALPILNLGLWLQRISDRITDIRISVGPSGPTPQRISSAEEVLRGQYPNQKTIQDALEALLQQVHFRTTLHRASEDYRKQLAGLLLLEALETAWQRANS
jgi:xanthine dehydrogenase FAD-binding subunit